jgi:hypothetical protein
MTLFRLASVALHRRIIPSLISGMPVTDDPSVAEATQSPERGRVEAGRVEKIYVVVREVSRPRSTSDVSTQD